MRWTRKLRAIGFEPTDEEADIIGLQVGTTNKHYRKLTQIHSSCASKSAQCFRG